MLELPVKRTAAWTFCLPVRDVTVTYPSVLPRNISPFIKQREWGCADSDLVDL